MGSIVLLCFCCFRSVVGIIIISSPLSICFDIHVYYPFILTLMFIKNLFPKIIYKLSKLMSKFFMRTPFVKGNKSLNLVWFK